MFAVKLMPYTNKLLIKKTTMKMKRILRTIVMAAGLLFCMLPMQVLAKTVDITVGFNENGTVLFDGQSLSSGDIVTAETDGEIEFTLIPDEGYFIKDVLLNGESELYGSLSDRLVPDAGRTAHYYYLPLVAGDSELEIVFAPQVNPHQVVISYNEGGAVMFNSENVTSNQATTIGEGEIMTFLVTRNNSNTSIELYYNDKRVASMASGGSFGNTLTVSYPSMEELAAIFGQNPAYSEWRVVFTPPGGNDDEKTITVSITHNEGGNVKLNDEDILTKSYPFRDNEIVILVSPDENMKIAGFSWNDMPYLYNPEYRQNRYTFTDVPFDMNCVITFEERFDCEVAVSGNEGGKVLINDQDVLSDIIKEGEEVAFTIVPENGYYIEDVFFKGKSVKDQLIWDNSAKSASKLVVPSPSATYVSQIVTEQAGLEARFEPLTISADDADVLQLKIYAGSGKLIVENAAVGETVSIYTQTGLCVKAEQANSGRMEIQLPAGIYIVKAGETAVKIIL